jgi:DMSO/TMAO reductase YedYZ heme-binding membrane subunit
VGIEGAFIPGLSSYRSSPVALGTLALYALLVTGITARYTSLLPRGVWLKLHRLSLVAFIFGWLHGLLAGTDSAALRPLYLATGLLVLAATAYRYWVTKKGRPTFAASLERPGRGDGVPAGLLHGPAASVRIATEEHTR